MRNQSILRKSVTIGLSVAAMTVGGVAMAAPTKGTVSVLNWWTSGSEAKSMNVLQQMMADKGYKMVNDAVSGGGGSNARTVLKSRIQSNNLPGAAQIKGPEIQQWCTTGLTMNIDKVAKQQHWSKILPGPVAKGMQCDGHYVAVPFNLHRINWLWINKSVMEKAGAKMPTDWDSLVAALEKLKKAGVTPIAGGGDTWQVATEFDAIAIATGGADFYRKAFVDLDQDALSSDTMAKTFKRLRTIQQYEDPNGQGLSWNHDTGLVVQGKAGMQIMGDWAKGEITNADATPGKQIACIAFPGEHSGFVYNADCIRDVQELAFGQERPVCLRAYRAFTEVPAQVQHGQGLDPGTRGRLAQGLRLLCATVQEGLHRGREEQRPGAELLPGHGRERRGQGRDLRRHRQVLQRQEHDAGSRSQGHGEPGQAGQDDVADVAGGHVPPHCKPAHTRRLFSDMPPRTTDTPTWLNHRLLPARAAATPWRRRLDRWLPKFSLVPSGLASLIFVYGFIAWTIWLSLTNSTLLPTNNFAGLRQYEVLFQLDIWWVSVINLAIFGILYVAICLAIGLFLAIMLDQKIRTEGWLRTIYLYPWPCLWWLPAWSGSGCSTRASGCSISCNR